MRSRRANYLSQSQYRPGDWLYNCPVCGVTVFHSETKKRWDGVTVCRWDWDPKHPSLMTPEKYNDPKPVHDISNQRPNVYHDATEFDGTEDEYQL